MKKEFIYTRKRIRRFYTENHVFANHLGYLKRSRGEKVKAVFPDKPLIEKEIWMMANLRFEAQLKGMDVDLSDSPECVEYYNGYLGTIPIWHRKTGEVRHHKSHNTKSNLLFHVTQKPEQLIRYLIRLVTPKGGTVLDPFLGSGTTLVAARLEGMSAYGIEIGTEYEPLIKGRLNALPRALEEFHQPTTKPSPKESIKYTQETE